MSMEALILKYVNEEHGRSNEEKDILVQSNKKVKTEAPKKEPPLSNVEMDNKEPFVEKGVFK